MLARHATLFLSVLLIRFFLLNVDQKKAAPAMVLSSPRAAIAQQNYYRPNPDTRKRAAPEERLKQAQIAATAAMRTAPTCFCGAIYIFGFQCQGTTAGITSTNYVMTIAALIRCGNPFFETVG